MSLYPQALLDIHDELIVDLFAGGGGASSGIEQALGRMVDFAINHDKIAVGIHRANHPQTVHFCQDVFEVDPRQVCDGRPIGLLWASPDCTHHSKARGGKPLRTTRRRSLAWVVTRWAAQVRPRVIILENVEEFQKWGPLVGLPGLLRPCKKRLGKTFKKWVKSLTNLGYAVEWRELRAHEYGAPTIRKRLYLIARCDGEPIVWPETTHGPGLKPFRTTAEQIDWSVPMLSIFATKEEAREFARMFGVGVPQRPLKDNSLRRIARGVMKFVVNNPKPFIVGHGTVAPMTIPLCHSTSKRTGQPANQPLSTITTAKGGEIGLAVPFLIPRYGERKGQQPRCRAANSPGPVVVPTANGQSLVSASLIAYHDEKWAINPRAKGIDVPLDTLDTSNRFGVSAAFLAQNNGGFYDGDGRPVEEPCSTILTNSRGHHGLTVAHVHRDFGNAGSSGLESPIGTLTSEGNGKAAVVASFLTKYFGTGTGQEVDELLHTATAKDRSGLVSVIVDGETYVIADIFMRMLTPRELFRCQGFRDSYIIDRLEDGTPVTKSDQVRLCGNSVCPDVAQALAAANCSNMIARSAKDMARVAV